MRRLPSEPRVHARGSWPSVLAGRAGPKGDAFASACARLGPPCSATADDLRAGTMLCAGEMRADWRTAPTILAATRGKRLVATKRTCN